MAADFQKCSPRARGLDHRIVGDASLVGRAASHGPSIASQDDSTTNPAESGRRLSATYDAPPCPSPIASFTAVPAQFTDDQRIVDALAARGVGPIVIPWDDPDADWRAFDAVVIRSTWDYARRREEFLRWCDSIGRRLHNCAALVRWNSDKRYLGDLGAAGIPVVDTAYVAPGEQLRRWKARSSSSRRSPPAVATRGASARLPTTWPID